MLTLFTQNSINQYGTAQRKTLDHRGIDLPSPGNQNRISPLLVCSVWQFPALRLCNERCFSFDSNKVSLPVKREKPLYMRPHEEYTSLMEMPCMNALMKPVPLHAGLGKTTGPPMSAGPNMLIRCRASLGLEGLCTWWGDIWLWKQPEPANLQTAHDPHSLQIPLEVKRIKSSTRDTHTTKPFWK